MAAMRACFRFDSATDPIAIFEQLDPVSPHIHELSAQLWIPAQLTSMCRRE